MLFSIIIATCGRPDRLVTALRAVESVIVASGERHSIVVVDNGPGYPAADVVREFAAGSTVRVQYLRSEPRSKSAALNTGIKAAETEWLAFTDDDTLPDVQWLSAAARYVARGECRVFGGQVIAGDLKRVLPTWFPAAMSERLPWIGVFVGYAPLAGSGILDEHAQVPLGANFFVRRDVFEEHGVYDELLWRLCGRAALGAEDAEFGMRVRRRGERVGYCREAVVVHPVHDERITLPVLLRLAFYYGWREPMLFPESGGVGFGWRAARLVASLSIRLLARGLRGDTASAVVALLQLSRLFGNAMCRTSSSYRQWVRACRLRGPGFVPRLESEQSGS